MYLLYNYNLNNLRHCYLTLIIISGDLYHSFSSHLSVVMNYKRIYFTNKIIVYSNVFRSLYSGQYWTLVSNKNIRKY